MRRRWISLLSVVVMLALGASTVQATEVFLPWSTPVKVEGMSAVRLSAVWYKDQLHIAHGGKDSDAVWHAWWDGKQWMTNRVSNLDGRGTPALVVYQNTLHMIYKGDNNTLWHATSEGHNWTPRGKIPGQKSHYNPSVVLYPYGNQYASSPGGQGGEVLWMWHGGGSKDSKRDEWFSFFDGAAWTPDMKMTGVAENTQALCMHGALLYRASVYFSGITVLSFSSAGWLPTGAKPKDGHSTTPVCLVSDGSDLFMFYRHSRAGSGKPEPIHASVLKGTSWENPWPVKDFLASDSPVVVAVPGKKKQFHLLFTRNKEIYLSSTLTLQPGLKPVMVVPAK